VATGVVARAAARAGEMAGVMAAVEGAVVSNRFHIHGRKVVDRVFLPPNM